MRSLRTAIFWITGILLWVFALSIGLAWLDFGTFDVRTAVTMGLMLVPLLAVAVGVLAWTRAQEAREEEEARKSERPAESTTSEAAVTDQQHGRSSAVRAAIRPPVVDLKKSAKASSKARTMETIEKGESQ